MQTTLQPMPSKSGICKQNCKYIQWHKKAENGEGGAPRAQKFKDAEIINDYLRCTWIITGAQFNNW